MIATFLRHEAVRRAGRLRAVSRIEWPPLIRLLGRRKSGNMGDCPPPASPKQEDLLTSSPVLTRSIVLKPPLADGERGVLLVQFEYNWYRLLAQVPEWDLIERRYDVIWGTSWSPTDYVLLDWILRRTNGPLIMLPSHPLDSRRVAALDSRIRCPDVLSACDWIDPAGFHPRPWNERDIDILMVANWAPFKRHFELFLALQRLPPTLRVALIGQPESGFTADAIRQLARTLRVPQRLDIHERLKIEAVHEMQCRSKVALILSRREGSCVAAVEALFAGAALGMRADAHVGALCHVNDSTGMRLTPGRLALELPVLLERSKHLHPRDWAEEHASCQHALFKLNQFMKSLAVERGIPWTRDLAAMRWNPYPELIDPQDQAVQDREWASLAELFPGPFGVSAN